MPMEQVEKIFLKKKKGEIFTVFNIEHARYVAIN